MEEESRDILMSTLMESGVLIPGDFSSVGEFTPEALVSISAQLLNLIDPSASFSDELPDSLPERFRICTDIAQSVKNLGYISDMSYYKFLHPSEDDSYRLVRFLVERLSEKNEGIKTLTAGDIASRPKVENFRDISDDWMVKEGKDETFDMHIQKVEAVLKDLTMASEISHSPDSLAKNTSTNGSADVDFFSRKTDDPVTDVPSDISLRESSGYEDPSETNYETVELQNQHNVLLEELESGSSELCILESELELLKVAAERLLDDKQPDGSYLEQLNQQLVVKRCNIMDVKKQWDDVRLTLETKKLLLLDQLHVEEPEAKEKFHQLRKTELDLQSLLSEIQKREDERCNLYNELERQPKAAPRKSYIHGIKEITKNSRKLDTDIQRISGETRELQLESNSIQERLHRSYAVVDEMVTREVKKDPAVRQVYKLLTSIHSIFEQISEKILMTDRFRRETVDYEKKLGSITARGMSLEKLQADLDAIRKENESLKK
ncbi:Coiled-coil domain-containing protein 22 [Arabidopsis thaliana x Arabidopsis arenosa]|uniref:Coiled-coil domain-containing protein 22 n=1 Tax=Arabidopsis thaliana x Arabidopsis arenosa TaxID=1240361 RepID=A0A8T2C7M1_9BRAS|nr:Coiled-coil domain-containing protein 22 [Arabidopsis thaliana x Arabidopsis arenosa]